MLTTFEIAVLLMMWSGAPDARVTGEAEQDVCVGHGNR